MIKQFFKKKLKLKAGICILAMMAGGFALSGCGSQSSNYQTTGFAMGTVISQNIYGGDEELAEQVLNIISELEQIISWRLNDSETAKINENAGTKTATDVSEKMAGWLTQCKEVSEKSGGRLDISVGPAARLWDIGGENPRIPEEQELAEALAKVGMEQLRVDGNQVTFDSVGGQLDLGAVGKGIGCDEILAFLQEEKEEISGTFSVGGSVLIYGAKPGGQAWRIGIRDPRGEEGEYMAALNFEQKEQEWICVSTSGDYEKYFEENGVRYHHILDPETGAPALTDVISVTVISESGFLTDALSTACLIAGSEEGLKIAEQFGAEAILITQDKEVIMTEGAAGYFELLDKEYKIKNEKE